MFAAWAILSLAIVIEVVATALLPRTGGFTVPGWTLLVIGGYSVSIWLLAYVVKTMPVSIAYAVWSGAGTALVAVIGVTMLGEDVDAVKVAGLTAIVAGVVLVNLPGAH